MFKNRKIGKAYPGNKKIAQCEERQIWKDLWKVNKRAGDRLNPVEDGKQNATPPVFPL